MYIQRNVRRLQVEEHLVLDSPERTPNLTTVIPQFEKYLEIQMREDLDKTLKMKEKKQEKIKKTSQ